MLLLYRAIRCLVIGLMLFGAASANSDVLEKNTYEVRMGDFGGDGDTDILLMPKNKVLLLDLDDLLVPILLRSSFPAYLLENVGNNTYQLSASVTVAQLESVTWTDSGYVSLVGDFNGDGLEDLFLQGADNGDASFVLHAATDDTLSLTQQINSDSIVVANAALTLTDNSHDGREDLVINNVQIVHANIQGQFGGVDGGWNVSGGSFVGTTHGAGGVNPAGAAVYNFNISLPSDSIKLKPGLSLNYNSRAGSGLLGVGWNLGGLSSIQRCGPVMSQDGYSHGDAYTDKERFCLDGQKLMVINGSYGDDNAEYRTEVNNMSRIVSYGVAGSGPARFKVWTKNGLVLEYGYTTESQLTASGRAEVETWSVNRVEDLFGNYYTVNYVENESTGEFYPDRIEYGGGPSNVNPLYSVTFTYQDRPVDSQTNRADQIWGYRAGSQFKTTKLLDKITVSQGSMPVREYDLAYVQSALTGRMRLDSLDQCGWDLQGVVRTCGRTTNFSWHDGNENFAAPSEITGLTGSLTQSRAPLVFDINNDGYKDLMWANGTTWYVKTGSPEGFSSTAAVGSFQDNWQGQYGVPWADPNYWHLSVPVKMWTDNWHLLTPILRYDPGTGIYFLAWYLQYWDNNWQVNNNLFSFFLRDYWGPTLGNSPVTADFNSDGLWDDTLFFSEWYGNIAKIFFKNTTHPLNTQLYPVNDYDVGGINNYQFTTWGSQTFDYEGDGYQDILVKKTTDQKGWYIIRSGDYDDISLSGYGATTAGSSLNYSMKSPELSGLPFGDGPNGNGLVMDVNGDGLGDFVSKVNGTWRIYVNQGGSWSTEIDTEISSGEADGQAVPMDYDGDGILDLLVKHPTNNTWRFLLTVQKVVGGERRPAFEIIETGIVSHGYLADPLAANPNSLFELLPVDIKPIAVDVDNDDKGDLIYLDQSTDTWMLMRRDSSPVDHLASVTDGFGATTAFTYHAINNTDIYTHDNITAWPTQHIHNGLQVVSEFKESDGLGGDRVKTYTYAGAKINLQGRGFLGFATRTITDQQTGLVTTENYHQEFPYIGLLQDSRVTLGANTVAEIQNTWGSRSLNNDTNKMVTLDYVLQRQFDLVSGLEVSAVRTSNGFDDYNTLTSAITITGAGWNGTFINDVISNVTTTLYSANDEANWLLGFITRREVIYSRPGETDKIVESRFVQKAGTLAVEQQTDFFGTNVERVTQTFWDSYGNVERKEVSGTNVGNSVVSEQSYTSGDHRHPSYIGNALFGHNVQYDLRFGKPSQLIDANGRVSTVNYDVFGRVIKEARHDGVETNTRYNYCFGAPCPSGAIYSVTTAVTHPSRSGIYGAPPQVVYYDMLGREIRRETQGYMGYSIYRDTVYDALGRVERVSEPYRSGDQIYWTEVEYDALGREIARTKPDNTTITTIYSASPTYATRVTKTVEVAAPGAASTTQVSTQHFNELGELVESVNDDNVATHYAYNAQGYLRWTRVNGDATTVITTVHDEAGNRISITDPDAGTTTSSYDALGQLLSQTNANNKQSTYTYDALGRMTTRNRFGDGTTTWYYDSVSTPVAETEYGQLLRVVLSTGYEEAFSYDGSGRLQEHTTLISGRQPYLFTYTYDAFGRVDVTYSPSNHGQRNRYNDYGYLEVVEDITTGAGAVWQALDSDARGNIVAERLGNGLGTQRSYDPEIGHLQAIMTGQWSGNGLADRSIQDLSYVYDNIGNLYSRSSARGSENLTENFTYDSLNRLETATTTGLSTGTRTLTYDYDALGNITNKSDVGAYRYGGACTGGGYGPHAVCEISGVVNATYAYDAAGNMTSSAGRTVAYNRFNKPDSITQGGTVTTFQYAANDDLYYQQVTGNGNTQETYTIAGGAYVEEVDQSSGLTKRKTSIGGVALHIETDDGVSSLTQTIQYLHVDHLGSTESITDASGNLIVRTPFDPFGNRRRDDWADMSATDWSAIIGITFGTTSQGYTGHEQLDEHRLIHMGGRVYDPVLGRFMSADPFIKNIANAQHFNRYSYVSNRPLSLVDPSGYLEEVVVTASYWGGFSGGYGSGGGWGFVQNLQILAQIQQAITQMQSKTMSEYMRNAIAAAGGIDDSAMPKPNNFSDQQPTRDMTGQVAGQDSAVQESQGQTDGLGKEAGGQEGNSTENWFASGDHEYTHISPAVCSASAEGCTQEKVVNALNVNGVHPNQEKPFVPGKPYTADVDIPGPYGKDPIKTVAVYDSKGNQIGIKNMTLPDHVLHPGFVERTVINIDNSFHIKTYGGGTGPLGGPNIWLGGFVWGPVDNNVIEQFR